MGVVGIGLASTDARSDLLHTVAPASERTRAAGERAGEAGHLLW